MNKEYKNANAKAQELMSLLDQMIAGIEELKKLENVTICEDQEIKDHRIKMIDYMERESDQLSHSIDSYMEAETNGK